MTKLHKKPTARIVVLRRNRALKKARKALAEKRAEAKRAAREIPIADIVKNFESNNRTLADLAGIAQETPLLGTLQQELQAAMGARVLAEFDLESARQRLDSATKAVGLAVVRLEAHTKIILAGG